MDGEAISAIGVIILGGGQLWIQYRLKQQDNARDAARTEMKKTAASVRAETEAVAGKVAKKVDQAAENTDVKLNEIHVMVNTRLSEALERVQDLESKLGLARNEAIPSPPTITERTDD